jgi:hypothetical protein
MDFRLDAHDEFPHQPDGSANFNESVYLNAAATRGIGGGIGGWMRLGNRVGEGHAELAVCLYLPDGRIACRFARPSIATNAQLDAGGLRYEVLTPLRQVRMCYDGEVLLLDSPDRLRDPKSLAAMPRVAASVAWTLTGISPVHGGAPTSPDVETMYGRDFSLGHFNQNGRVDGHIRIGEQQWRVDGGGWRDHSWGPRHWQNLSYHRLFTATFPDGRGFMLLKIGGEALRARRFGVLLVDGAYEEIVDLDVATDWSVERDPVRVHIGVRTARRAARIEGEVVGLAPLRHRREVDGVTLELRIAEGFTRFTWDGASAFGMTEYSDRIGDGRMLGYPL